MRTGHTFETSMQRVSGKGRNMEETSQHLEIATLAWFRAIPLAPASGLPYRPARLVVGRGGPGHWRIQLTVLRKTSCMSVMALCRAS